MKLIRLTITTLIATLHAASAQAQNTGAQDRGVKDEKAEERGVYVGLGGIAYDSEAFGVEGKVGYNFNKYFGVEGQGSIGVSSQTFPTFDSPTAATVSQKVDYSVGAFGVARLPLGRQFEVFARAGVHNTQTSTEISNILMTNFNETFTNYAVGGGAQYNVNEKNGVRFDYTFLGGINGGTASLGYVRKF